MLLVKKTKQTSPAERIITHKISFLDGNEHIELQHMIVSLYVLAIAIELNKMVTYVCLKLPL